jgi:hypothetical protein
MVMTMTAMFAQDAKQWLAEGNAKYAEKQYAAALELFTKAAEKGLAEAQFNLGMMYYQGEAVSKDYTSAAMWFKRAARQRYAKAEYNLACCYINGNGVPINYEQALMYMKASALRGYVPAQRKLAELYGKGILVEADSVESKRWLAMSKGEDVDIAPEVERVTKLVAPPQPATAPAATDSATTAATAKSSKVQNKKVVLTSAAHTVVSTSAVATAPSAAPSPASAQVGDIVPADTARVDSAEINALKKKMLELALGPKSLDVMPEESELEDPSAPADNEYDIPMSTLAMRDRNTPASTAPTPSTTSNSQQKIEEEVTQANGAPVVRILFPEDQSLFHTDVVKLKYQLLAQGLEATTKVTVMVDGVRQPENRAVKQANTIEVEVPSRDCTITLFAQNERGNSIPAIIRLIRENVTQLDMPKLFAVCVGVGQYTDDKLPPLKMTVKDAQDFATAVQSKKGCPFSEVQVKVLCDQEATRGDIFEAMQWMAQEARPNDLCMFFFAGHGYRDERDRFFFMPYGGNTNRTYECFSATDFKDAADKINSKFIVFADACYSAGLLEGNRSASAEHFVEQLRRSKNGMILYASSSGDTKSKEDPKWGNGAFTKALVEAFYGAARQEGDEGLSTRALDAYLYDAVRRTTGYKQTPVFMNPSGIEHFNIFTYEK